MTIIFPPVLFCDRSIRPENFFFVIKGKVLIKFVSLVYIESERQPFEYDLLEIEGKNELHIRTNKLKQSPVYTGNRFFSFLHLLVIILLIFYPVIKQMNHYYVISILGEMNIALVCIDRANGDH